LKEEQVLLKKEKNADPMPVLIVDDPRLANRASMRILAMQGYHTAVLKIDPNASVIVTDPKTELEGLFKQQTRKQHSQRKWKHIGHTPLRYFDEGYFFTQIAGPSEVIKKYFRRGARKS
jgi:hypothetical protein